MVKSDDRCAPVLGTGSGEMFEARLRQRLPKLRELYLSLYESEDEFNRLLFAMQRYAGERDEALRLLDRERIADPGWYQGNDLLGMMLYIDNFAGDIKGVSERIPYLIETGVNYLHLMPFLETVEGESDGGYAVKDFRKVEPTLGTMEELRALAVKCHEQKIWLCMDFVMNHTSKEHEWARRARKGEAEYRSYYFFYENDLIPNEYEKTMPSVFPETAPGNFTYLPEEDVYVMTTFYPYQWDLNYKNPTVFLKMTENLLFLANQGIDVLRIDAIPYIWKELGTTCRNLPKVHTIAALLRLICEIVCPGVILLGEVVMEPSKVVPYFGAGDRRECHMLYNVTTMATIWHTVATKDTALLKHQLSLNFQVLERGVFLNYLRCHDDIGWGLDFDFLAGQGMNETAHKLFLNDYFQGKIFDSPSRGELYNYDPKTQDGRFCATTASMCGIEAAMNSSAKIDGNALSTAIRLDLMLHAFIFAQSGIPILYSGDEVGACNDYRYHEDPKRCEDSRYVHRGAINWEVLSELRAHQGVASGIYYGLQRLWECRQKETVFHSLAKCSLVETWDSQTIAFSREYEEERLIAIYNFSPEARMAWINEEDGMYEDLITGRQMKASGIHLAGYGYYWLKRLKAENSD